MNTPKSLQKELLITAVRDSCHAAYPGGIDPYPVVGTWIAAYPLSAVYMGTWTLYVACGLWYLLPVSAFSLLLLFWFGLIRL